MKQISEQGDEIDLRELFAAIRHNWGIVSLVSACVAVLAAYYAFAAATPIYKASTRFELLEDDAGGSLLGSTGGLAALAGIGIQANSTEADALQDRILSRPFVASIYEEAEFSTDAEFNATLRKPGFVSGVTKVLLGKSETENLTKNDFLVMAVASLTDSLTITPGDNGIIELTIKHPNPDRAATIANIVVKQALLDIFERERQSTKDSLSYFADQLLEVRANLDAATSALRDYAISNNLQSQQDLARTSSQLAQVRREIETLDNSLIALAQISDQGFDGAEFAKTNPVAASLSFRRLLNLSGDPNDWKAPLPKEISVAKEQLETQRETLVVSFNAIEARAKSSGAEALKLAALEREVEVQQAIYETVITQFEARSLTSGYEQASGRVVEYAIPPNIPWSPNKKLFVALGLLLGGILGSGLVVALKNRLGTIYTLPTFRDAFAYTEIRKCKQSNFGKLNQSSLDARQLSSNQDVLISVGEDKQIVGVLSTTSSDMSARVAYSLSIASSRLGEKTALLNLSKEVFKKTFKSTDALKIAAFSSHEIAPYVALLRPDKSEIFLNVSKAEEQLNELRKTFDRIFILLPSSQDEAPLTRVCAQIFDAALIVAETAKTNQATANAIEGMLAKSKISDPLLLVT